MSVYRPKGSPCYQFDFQWRGRRFHGSTKRTNRREAESIERAERERAKREAAQARAGSPLLTLDAATGRYWVEVGKDHAAADTTWRDLERLISYFGPTKLWTEITDDDVTRLVAWRRGQPVARHRKREMKKPADDPLVANATVNRSTTEVLKKLFTRAKRAWSASFDHEPDWSKKWLSEPKERVRELHADESDRLDAATRHDYEPFFAFARATGFRLRECLLKWSEVYWDTRQIVKPGKGGRTIVAPITPVVRSILWPLRGHDPEHVFTYIAMRTRGSRVKGRRYPLTYNGVKAQWKRTRKRAKVKGFRFHDFRHDLATKLLRATGNLKLVQRALNHADLKTTARYAHVLTEDVAAGLESLQGSRKKSRTFTRKAS